MKSLLRRLVSILGITTILFGSSNWSAPAVTVQAAKEYAPSSVTIAGSLQSEIGCAGDWDPACAASHLAYDANDDVWQAAWDIPLGGYEYKAALNDSWDENYGLHAALNGGNIPLTLAANASVKFYYDDATHWVTDNHSSVIVTVPGSFQSELGCSGDWDPGCLRSWLKDPSGSGTYSLETTALPAGTYEAKAAINESWDENYGANGAPGGANIIFTVPTDHAKVAFRYNPGSHILEIQAGHGADNNVEWDGLRHDSRSLLYRTPGGAVPAGTAVKIRFRTFHKDVSVVKLRVFDLNTNAQALYSMDLAASGVSCYQTGLEGEQCDYYETSLANAAPNNLWYRFLVTDGSKTVYYADNTPALDGGLGAPSDQVVDNSFALMVYDPKFTTPKWSQNAIIYQIFPDRFRNGTMTNDPKSGMAQYDDPAIFLPWGSLPEGYCRNYADGSTNCPWRFDTTPPESSPTKENPRGRDYFGGDLKGVTDKLDYLKNLGVTVIYFNPIFDAQSNHRYDTADYTRIDPALGTLKDFTKLTTEAQKRGIRIVLDGVFNHLSSDSSLFDRYHHYTTLGACEAAASSWRTWFTFRPPSPSEPSPCVPATPGGNDTYYDGWFSFDSIPVINKSNPAVQSYFLTAPDSVTRRWLNNGASGWRMDVMGDASFPANYWNTFRSVVKQTSPNALIIGELWQKDSTLLRFLRGDRADTTMNYRLRDAVIGLLVPGSFDSKGFADSGDPLKPSEFAARIQSIREDYPDAAYYSLMNLLDSHDTERLRWTLTPGDETTAAKEQNAANVSAGKTRVRLASLIQYTLPGSPTVYYGDEVGMTGDDDPDDRRTFPWTDTGGTIDTALLSHYQSLAAMRKSSAALTSGDLRVLVADDAANVVAYGRKTSNRAAIVALNTGAAAQTITIPVAEYLPNGVSFYRVYGVNYNSTQVIKTANGALQVTLNPLSGVVLTSGQVDLAAPAAPSGLKVTAEGNAQVSLNWTAVQGINAYNVYRSPLSGGGYVLANSAPVTGTTFTDTGLNNAARYYYIVRSVKTSGIESAPSKEVSALPHLTIGWANTQWPPNIQHTISAVNRSPDVYGQVWIDGATEQAGQTPTLRAQLGFGPQGSAPANNPAWTWVEAAFNINAGSNDEFKASLLPETTGTFHYAYRYTTTGGRDWLYADLNGPAANPAAALTNPGVMTVIASEDITPPAAPTSLRVNSASPVGVDLAWDAPSGDPTLYGFEVLRANSAGGPYTLVARVTAASFTDGSVTEGSTYYYVVRSVDQSFNRSDNSAEVTAKAELRTVSLVFNVTVPDTTDGTGRSVYIAGSLDRLDGGLPSWNPGGVIMTRVDATHWTVTLTGKENTSIEYKYALADWDHVEKDGACGEIGNRQLSLTYGSNGAQSVNDAVLNWRNIAPCGN